jgi:hypothetical protein
MASKERTGLWIVRIAGGATILLFLAMGSVMPRQPVEGMQDGFQNPILAFEMASKPEEVFAILGHPDNPKREAAVRGMDLGNLLDYLFMIAYPAIFAGVALVLHARGHLPLAAAQSVLALAVVMFVGDALENWQLLTLSKLVDPAAMVGPLARLRPFALAKFGAFFAASAILAIGLWREPSAWRWAAMAFGLGAVLGGYGVLVYLPAIEWGTFPVALGWITAWVHALRTPTPRTS